jgi:hypothetical protein
MIFESVSLVVRDATISVAITVAMLADVCKSELALSLSDIRSIKPFEALVPLRVVDAFLTDASHVLAA